MSNTNFISFPKKVSIPWILESIKPIVSERFGNKLVVEKDQRFDQVVVRLNENLEGTPYAEHMYPVEFWVESPKKIGYPYPHSQFGVWIMVFIENELSCRHNGKISSEGCSGTWRGESNKYPTFLDWGKKMWGIEGDYVINNIFPKELFEF